MTDKTKGIIALVSGIIMLIVGVVALIIAKNTQLMTAFEWVLKNGGVQSTQDPNLALYKGYLFYNNNRVVIEHPTNPLKGTYTKDVVKWDNGTTTLMSDIFK